MAQQTIRLPQFFQIIEIIYMVCQETIHYMGMLVMIYYMVALVMTVCTAAPVMIPMYLKRIMVRTMWRIPRDSARSSY